MSSYKPKSLYQKLFIVQLISMNLFSEYKLSCPNFSGHNLTYVNSSVGKVEDIQIIYMQQILSYNDNIMHIQVNIFHNSEIKINNIKLFPTYLGMVNKRSTTSKQSTRQCHMYNIVSKFKQRLSRNNRRRRINFGLNKSYPISKFTTSLRIMSVGMTQTKIEIRDKILKFSKSSKENGTQQKSQAN